MSTQISFTGIVLCGGLSQRFGRDKRLLAVGGLTRWERVLDVLSPVVDRTAIIVAPNDSVNWIRLAPRKTEVIEDDSGTYGRSALAGMVAGLSWAARADWTFVIACDLPLLSTEFLLRLKRAAYNRGPAIGTIVPRWPNGEIEPLCAVYRTKPSFEMAQSALHARRMRLAHLVDRLNPEFMALSESDRPCLLNVNTPEDLARVSSCSTTTPAVAVQSIGGRI